MSLIPSYPLGTAFDHLACWRHLCTCSLLHMPPGWTVVMCFFAGSLLFPTFSTLSPRQSSYCQSLAGYLAYSWFSQHVWHVDLKANMIYQGRADNTCPGQDIEKKEGVSGSIICRNPRTIPREKEWKENIKGQLLGKDLVKKRGRAFQTRRHDVLHRQERWVTWPAMEVLRFGCTRSRESLGKGC